MLNRYMPGTPIAPWLASEFTNGAIKKWIPHLTPGPVKDILHAIQEQIQTYSDGLKKVISAEECNEIVTYLASMECIHANVNIQISRILEITLPHLRMEELEKALTTLEDNRKK